MMTQFRWSDLAGRIRATRPLTACACALTLLLVPGAAIALARQPAQTAGKPAHGVTYQHVEIPDGPWSVHVVKVERGNPEFEIHSAMARGNKFGLATLSEQIRALPPQIGKPVAGVNGDFFR